MVAVLVVCLVGMETGEVRTEETVASLVRLMIGALAACLLGAQDPASVLSHQSCNPG